LRQPRRQRRQPGLVRGLREAVLPGATAGAAGRNGEPPDRRRAQRREPRTAVARARRSTDARLEEAAVTSILCWNIKFWTNPNFSLISRTDALSAQHLVDVVRVVNPDILVVIEVRSSDTGGVGHLISNTGGAAGVLQLQGLL